MNKKLKQLNIRLSYFYSTIFFLIFVLIMLNNYVAIRRISLETRKTFTEGIMMYNNRLSDTFSTAEVYLTSFAYSSWSQLSIETTDTSKQRWFTAVKQYESSFDAALNIYGMNGFFLYSPNNDTFIWRTKNISDCSYSQIKTLVQDMAQSSRNIQNENLSSWHAEELNEQYYLFRIIRISNCYLGAYINTDDSLKALVGDNQQDKVFFSDKDGIIYNRTVSEEMRKTYQNTHTDANALSTRGSRQRFISYPTSFSDLYIVTYLPESMYTTIFQSFLPLIIALLLSILLLFVSSHILNKRWIIYPTRKIINAFNELTAGNLEVQIIPQDECFEFYQVFSSFNHMVGVIEDLKIDIYEEKLHKQYINSQYLKLQMAPHFLINCLNTVYHLSEVNRPDLQKSMLQSLSNHLRYTLSSAEFVTMEQELNQVKNYIELSLIRYPNSVQLHTQVDENTLSAAAIPLLLLNFIENTIKYEVELTQVTHIHLHIRRIICNNGDAVFLSIADSGNGFTPDILDRLHNYKKYLGDRQQKSIGIFNVIQRAEFFYGSGLCMFSFHNIPDSGALIEITIPYIPFQN